MSRKPEQKTGVQPGQQHDSKQTHDHVTLAARYLAETPAEGSGLTFGKPYRFGAPLAFKRDRDPLSQPGDELWRSLAYLDPALLWLPGSQPAALISSKQQPGPVKARVVAHHRSGSTGADQEQVPPPAAVTISQVQAQGISGITLHGKIAGVAVRESLHQHANITTGKTDGYTVHQRLSRSDVQKRLAEGGLLGALVGSKRRIQDHHVQPLTALQRIMQAWDAEEQAANLPPGPGEHQPPQPKPNDPTPLGGPAFTMGARVKPVLPGQSLQGPDAAAVPGPGQYDVVAVASRERGPAFTLGSKPKPPAVTELPGPGHYAADESSLGKGPAFTIAGKASDKSEELPGPGEYDVPRDIRTGPAVTIAGRPKPAAVEALPGPADYQQLKPAGHDAPAFTLYGRVEPVKPDAVHVPAPGEYELPTAWRTGPAVTIAGRPEQKACDCSPGPGQYNVITTSLDGPAYTIATRMPPPAAPDSPAPGDYYVEPSSSTAPAFTMAGKHAETTTEAASLPGPGQYNVLQHPRPGSPAAPAYSMGARPQVTATEDVPGPGTYDMGMDPGAVQAPAFTIAGKPLPAEPPDSPGPGQYDPLCVTESVPAFTMAARPKEAVAPDSPAPGDYEVTRPQSMGPAFSMPQAGIRPPPTPPSSPGPGEYEAHASAMPLQGPAFTIPATGRVEPKRPDSPAPGDYDVRLSTLEGPAYTMAVGRPDTPTKDVQPGPGEYFKPLSTQGPAFTIRTKPADPQPSMTNVGPGAYDIHDPAAPAPPAFTIAGRHQEPGMEQLPGPGAYDQPASPRGPAYTMAGSRPQGSPGAEQPGKDSPGPGAYQMPESPRGPAYTMPGRPAEGKPAEDVPGPGEYPPPQPDRGPAYTIRGRAADPAADPVPGPGDYHEPASPRGPAYTMAGRHQELTVLGDDVIIDPDIPGPGTYGAPGQDLIGSCGPAWTLGPRTKAIAWEGVPEEGGPGPGDYNHPPSPTGPAFTLGARTSAGPSQVQGGDSPGPGEYGAPMPPGGGPAFTLGGKLAAPRTTAMDSPAPGDYGSPGDTGPQGPAFSLGAKRHEPDPTMHLQVPGPGEHQRVLHPPTGPAFSLGKRLKDLLGLKKQQQGLQSGPEPGQYFTELARQGPAYTFGARSDHPNGCSSPVAPGDYDPIIDMRTGPAWTLLGKPHPPPAVQIHPGPGQYDHTARPALSSILSTRPEGRVEYVVTQYGQLPGSFNATSTARREHGVPEGGGAIGATQAAGTAAAFTAASDPGHRVPHRTSGGTSGKGVKQQQASGAGAQEPAAGKVHVGAKAQAGRAQGVPVKGTQQQQQHAVKAQGGHANKAPVKAIHYLSQPASTSYVYKPPAVAGNQRNKTGSTGAGRVVHQGAVQLAQPSVTYTTPAGSVLQPGQDPMVTSYLSGAAGKPAAGLVKRMQQKIAAPMAVVARTAAAGAVTVPEGHKAVSSQTVLRGGKGPTGKQVKASSSPLLHAGHSDLAGKLQQQYMQYNRHPQRGSASAAHVSGGLSQQPSFEFPVL